MRYGSICSGIEAATVAWEPLGWQAAWFAEVEPFPSAVLKYHYPEVSNLGDMTKIAVEILRGTVEAPELLVGGTPCQAFSIAGLREGLSDERGGLTIKYVELLNAIDYVRAGRREPAAIAVWENVPGVLSDRENAFGCFLAALAGDDSALVPGPRPERGRSGAFWKWDKKACRHLPKWPECGHVAGPRRTIAWRVLDAQYFGLAQRRRRVFVVASAREGFDPAAVLFEREGLRRDTPPRRETQENPAGTLTARAARSRGAGIEPEGIVAAPAPEEVAGTLTASYGEQTGRDLAEMPGGLQVAFGGNNQRGALDISTALRAHNGPHNDFESETFLVQTVTGDITHALNTANNGRGCSEDGTGRGVPIMAFSCKDNGRDASIDISPTLRAMNGERPNGGGQMAVAFAQNMHGELREGPVTGTLPAKPGITQTSHVRDGLAVRRFTPLECERLQGFPDNHTLIPRDQRKSVEVDMVAYYSRQLGRDLTAEECAYLASDGPRYKAIGNSKAVPVVRWIGRRIDLACSLTRGESYGSEKPFSGASHPVGQHH